SAAAAVLGHQPRHELPRNARRLRGARHIVVAHREHALEVRAFELLDRPPARLRERRQWRDAARRLEGIATDDAARDEIPQLAHVSGPLVRADECDELW